jgi:hypothetical protein
MDPEGSLLHLQVTAVWIFGNKICFYWEVSLAPRPSPKLEDHSLFAIRDCWFNIFADTIHTEGRSPIRNLRTHHAGVTGTHSSRSVLCTITGT